MYFDGMINVHGSIIGAILISLTGAHYPLAIKLIFPYTNKIVEYESSIAGHEAALDMNVKDLEVYKPRTSQVQKVFNQDLVLFAQYSLIIFRTPRINLQML